MKTEDINDKIKNNNNEFEEKRSYLTTVIHNYLHRDELFKHLPIEYDSAVYMKDYNSKYDAECARNKLLAKAYSNASDYFRPTSEFCVSRYISEEYARYIDKLFLPVMKNLEILYSLHNKETDFKKLEYIIQTFRKTMLDILNRELTEYENLYALHELDYYIKMADVEVFDYGTEEGFRGFLENLFCDTKSYTNLNTVESVEKIKNEVAENASAVFKYAHKEYSKILAEIGTLAEGLGKNLPDGNEEESLYDYLERIVTFYSKSRT